MQTKFSFSSPFLLETNQPILWMSPSALKVQVPQENPTFSTKFVIRRQFH